MKLAEFNWPDLEQVSRDVVVVFPIASLEQHGPHLQCTALRGSCTTRWEKSGKRDLTVGATPGRWRRQ